MAPSVIIRTSPMLPAVNHPPVRMGIFPESWFQAFYDKTGVSGPYMFGASVGAFLLSKEIWIIEHGFIEFVGFWLAMTYMVKKAGPGVAKSLDAMEANYRLKHWEEPIAKIKTDASAVVKAGEEGIWQEAGQKFLYEAKRENVDLQLESTYRQRLERSTLRSRSAWTTRWKLRPPSVVTSRLTWLTGLSATPSRASHRSRRRTPSPNALLT